MRLYLYGITPIMNASFTSIVPDVPRLAPMLRHTITNRHHGTSYQAGPIVTAETLRPSDGHGVFYESRSSSA